ncbi:MAG TPA: toll/interleukin-1 receptor domain-containing protein [Pyrinomonadaceae bacterium]
MYIEAMATRTTRQKSVKSAAKKGARKTATEKAQPRPPAPPAYKVFISYDSVEWFIANQIKKEIEARKAETWMDRKDLPGGGEIIKSINEGMGSCQEAVVLLSTHSATSQWVLYEIGVADAHGIHITAILNNMAPGEIAPLSNRSKRNLNAFDDFLLDLEGRMKSYFEGQAAGEVSE